MNFTRSYDVYMYAVGVIAPIAGYMQVYKIIESHSAGDISMLGNIVALIAAISWLIYGIIKKNYIIMIANAASVISEIAIVLGIILYG